MFVPVHPSQSTSPFAMELGQKIDSVIREYRRSHPGMSVKEIREAMRIAEAANDVGGMRRMIPALIAVASIAGLLVARTSRRWPPDAFQAAPWVLVVLGVILAVLLIRAARR